MEKEIEVLEIKLERGQEELKNQLHWIKSSVKSIEAALRLKNPLNMNLNSCGEFQSQIYKADMTIIEICMIIDSIKLLKKLK